MAKLTIGIPIYPDVDLLDIVGPHEIFSWLNTTWPGNEVTVLLVAETDAPVKTSKGAKLVPDVTFAESPPLDVLFVPGAPNAASAAESQPLLVDYVKAQGGRAEVKWVCSVCTGALILAKAGLLDGYRATTHWMALGSLRAYPNIRVAEGYPRYVVDGNRVTGGGISSGLDESLALAALVTGDPNVARKTQLAIQYHPQPDYDCGDPGVADAFILSAMRQAFSGKPVQQVAVPKVVDGAVPATGVYGA
ncbi:MAG TPA: DJ-1/PfpI family protein [Longimicrobium sp.]|nr:DJ-1/PfpI family protein [Longimicrobium sp.]